MGKHPPFGISLQYILVGTTEIYVPFNISAYVPVKEYVEQLAILQPRALGLRPCPEVATTMQRNTCSHAVMPLGRTPPRLIAMAACP